MEDKQDLTQAVVAELIDYHPVTGQLFWKPRGAHWFSSHSAWQSFNTRHAGNELNPGYTKANMLGVSQQKSRLVWMLHTGGLPDGRKWKVITVNRNTHDTRIENLVCVPMSVSLRQKKKEGPSNNLTTGIYGVSWNVGKQCYYSYYKPLEGKTVSKKFDHMADAYWFRKMAEPNHNYSTLSEFVTGDKLIKKFEPTTPGKHVFDPIVVSDKTRKLQSVSATGNSSRLKWRLIGTHAKSGSTIEFAGSGEAEALGFASSGIYRACNETHRTHKGYKWVKQLMTDKHRETQ